MQRYRFLGSVAFVFLLAPTRVTAAPPPDEPGWPPSDTPVVSDTYPTTDEGTLPGVKLGAPSPWTVGLEGHSGILNQWASGENRAHGFVGGELYARYSYVQAGPFLELTDSGEAPGIRESEQERFRTVGGFAGAWLPLENLVDVNASIGYGTRLYSNSSDIYGPRGLVERTSVLELRLAISDRTSARLIGARVGAALVGTADLDHHDAQWRRTSLRADGTAREILGTTPIGGVTLGLVVSVALEIGGG